MQLLVEENTTNDANKRVPGVFDEQIVLPSGDYELLVYLFVGGYAIRNATNVIDLCRGTGTALYERHSSREEIQVLRLQQAASSGRNTKVAIYKRDRAVIELTAFINDCLIDF